MDRPDNFPNRAPLDYVDIDPGSPFAAGPAWTALRIARWALFFAGLFGLGMLIGWLT